MNAETTITIFNSHVDTDRREVFVPTVIEGVSYLESLGSSDSQGIRSENLRFKLRIPVQAKIQSHRRYVREGLYAGLAESERLQSWTLKKGDYVLLADYEGESLAAQELMEMAKVQGLVLISISEYADNTIRGSDTVKHWRIGGA